jgi:hypothetical protein
LVKFSIFIRATIDGNLSHKHVETNQLVVEALVHHALCMQKMKEYHLVNGGIFIVSMFAVPFSLIFEKNIRSSKHKIVMTFHWLPHSSLFQ